MQEEEPGVVESEPLGLREKICYGIGDFSNGLAVSSIGIWLLIYLTDVVGLKPQYAGLAIVIGRVWDAVTDPLMGWITDNTKSRWGKRRPYLLFGAIPYALAFFMLWVVPEFDNQVFIFAYITVALIIFNTCLTVVFVPYTSLTAAITTSYSERTSLTGYRMAASQTAFLLGAVLPSALVAFVTSEKGIAVFQTSGLEKLFGAWSGNERAAYAILGAICAVTIIASIWTAFFGTRERDLESATVPSGEVEDTTPFNYASSIVDEIAGNHPFRSSVLILLFTNCAATFVAVLLPYYFQYVLQIHESKMKLFGLFTVNAQSSVFFTLFVFAIIAVPLWVKIAKARGKAETYRVAMLMYMFVLGGLAFIGVGQFKVMLVVAGIAGFFHSAAITLPWAMIPDVVEHDELRKGKRREGLFYGGTTLTYKLATALPVFLTSYILGIIGYVPNEPQTDGVVLGIRILIAGAPAILLSLGAYIAMKHPITAENHHLILEQLAARKKGASAIIQGKVEEHIPLSIEDEE